MRTINSLEELFETTEIESLITVYTYLEKRLNVNIIPQSNLVFEYEMQQIRQRLNELGVEMLDE